jgi:hypothetical protein
MRIEEAEEEGYGDEEEEEDKVSGMRRSLPYIPHEDAMRRKVRSMPNPGKERSY